MNADLEKYTADVANVYERLYQGVLTEGEQDDVFNSMLVLKALLERVYTDGWSDGYKEGLKDEPIV